MGILKKLWRLVNVRQRRAAFWLMGFMFIGMLLETVGIGLVIPALALMTKSNLGAEYPVLEPWLARLGNPSHEQLIIAGMLILVGVYVVKTLFLVFLTWKQTRFVAKFQASLSQRFFAGYLRQPYTFHLERNSAQLLHLILSQVGAITTVLQNGFLLLVELMVFLGISIMLLIVEPIGALLVMSTLGLAGWVFSRATRSRIAQWGVALQLHERLRIQQLQEGLGGVKDVKLLGREKDILEQYQQYNTISAKINQRQSMLQGLPRLWLELLAIIGLALLVMVMVGQGKPLQLLLPTLGLFAAAVFRLMPSVNRVLIAVQSVRFSLPVVHTLYSELCLLDDTALQQSASVLPFKKVLTLEQISFQYPGAKAPALSGINLSIPCGGSVGFISASGAGKSTLMDIILGLLAPVSGKVKVDGMDIQENLRGWQDQIGYVPQSIYLIDNTLRRNIAFGLAVDQIDEAAVNHAIKAAQLEQFVNELPQGLDTLVGERGVRLSGGQCQRIGIARALYHNPSILVLDEATSSLDSATEHEVMEAVRALQGQKTVLIVAHRLTTVKHCDRLYRLEQGALVEDKETLIKLNSQRENRSLVSTI